MAAKLRHISIQCDNPDELAKFYTEVFGMEIMYRAEAGNEFMRGGYIGVHLSDGTVSIELTRFGDPDFPNFAPKGLNHLGFVVEDLQAAVAKAAQEGGRILMTGEQLAAMGAQAGSGESAGALYGLKLTAPDGTAIDIQDPRGRGWPGISGLEDLGVTGTVTAERHRAGHAMGEELGS
jgi:catechol 2,3-dioxygenase-like lactoylglutathione lyase family enzyme